MRSRENNSFGRPQARYAYESSDISIREIARKVGVSEKSVRNWIKEDSWERNSAALPQPSPQPVPFEDDESTTVSIGQAAAQVAAEVERAVAAPHAPRTAQEIARDFCGTMDVLRAELDTVIRNLHLIRELAESDLDDPGEKASEARRKLLNKVLELPGLVKASNDLTAALSRLTEADPGKKEQQKTTAKQVGSAGRFATPSAPPIGQTAH